MSESFKSNAHKVLSWVTGSVEGDLSHASYVLSEETDSKPLILRKSSRQRLAWQS